MNNMESYHSPNDEFKKLKDKIQEAIEKLDGSFTESEYSYNGQNEYQTVPDLNTSIFFMNSPHEELNDNHLKEDIKGSRDPVKLEVELIKEMKYRNKFEELMEEEISTLQSTIDLSVKEKDMLESEIQKLKEELNQFRITSCMAKNFSSPGYVNEPQSADGYYHNYDPTYPRSFSSSELHNSFSPQQTLSLDDFKETTRSTKSDILSEVFEEQVKLVKTIEKLDYSIKKRENLFRKDLKDSGFRDYHVDSDFETTQSESEEHDDGPHDYNHMCHNPVEVFGSTGTFSSMENEASFHSIRRISETELSLESEERIVLKKVSHSSPQQSQIPQPYTPDVCKNLTNERIFETPIYSFKQESNSGIECPSDIEFERFRQDLRRRVGMSTLNNSTTPIHEPEKNNFNRINECINKENITNCSIHSNSTPEAMNNQEDLIEQRQETSLEIQDACTELTLLLADSHGSENDDALSQIEQLQNIVKSGRQKILKIDQQLQLYHDHQINM